VPDTTGDTSGSVAAPVALADGSQYDEKYYRDGLGPIAYGRTNQWLGHFANVADGLIRMVAPKTVLDVGCAFGMLVESLWDRGVRAEGIDISSYAISQVRPDIRPYVRIGRATEPLGGPYDVISCIEVLEHVAHEEIAPAIARMAAATDVILFSSSPDDFAEPTHVSVRPPLAWIRDFADAGFGIDLSADPTFLAPHAIVFRRARERQSEDVQMLGARLVRERVVSNARLGAIMAANAETKKARAHAAALTAEVETLRRQLAARGG